MGERAGVRGPKCQAWPPHPNPLPRTMHKVKDTSLAGEREQSIAKWRVPPYRAWLRRKADRNCLGNPRCRAWPSGIP